MYSDSSQQPESPGGHNHAAFGKEYLPLLFSQALFDAITSLDFDQEFGRRINELPKGDYRRARAYFITGGHFNLHYCRSGSRASLDRAIRCTEQAVEELPKSHEEFKTYVALYTDLLHERAWGPPKLEYVERYISGLQFCIQHLQECHFKERMRRQLGLAYHLSSSLTNKFEDINLVIQTLEGHFETAKKTYPQAALSMGAALYHRYQQEPQLDYLDRSVELLRKGLEAIPRGRLRDYCKIDVVLKYIASACAIVNRTPCSNDMRSRLINNLETVLSSTPSDSEEIGRCERERLQLIMTQCFKEPSVQEVKDTLTAGLVGEAADSQSPWTPPQLPSTIATIFIYEPLSDKRNIRLVKLLPGTRDDFVQCEIFEAAIDDLPDYEALSYVWGDPKDTERICVNGAVHGTTKNLYSALLRLRQYEAERTLWVDALCINQLDVDEKRHQISFMPDIYTKASTVIMWLGEPEAEEPPLTSPEPKKAKVILNPTRQVVLLAKDSPDSEHQQKHASVPPVPMLDQSRGWHWFTKEELPTFIEKYKWLEPFIRGCKPAVPISQDGIPGFIAYVQDVVEDIEWEELKWLFYRNIQFRCLPGLQLEVFDWSSPENIPSFFRAPQSRTMWPVLGAFTLIHGFSQHKHFHELPFFGGATKVPFLKGGDIDLTYFSGIAWRKSVRALERILTSEYWHRAWILQEIVLSPKPMVHYGPHIMPFTELLRASWSFEIQYNGCCSKWGSKAYRTDDTHWTTLRHGFGVFGYMDLLRGDRGLATFSSGMAGHRWSLSDILRTGITKRKATDPRDLVYGILGLVDDDTGIEADYTISVAEVFARAAMHIVRQEHSLAMLLFNQFGRHPKNDLPSWVPDWSTNAKFFPIEYPEKIYNIGNTRTFLAELEDGLELRVRTVKVDTIKKVTGMRTKSFIHVKELIAQLVEWRRMAGLDSPIPKLDPGHDQVGEPGDQEGFFWRAVFADAMFEHDMEHPEAFMQQRDHEEMRRFEPRDEAKVLAWWNWLQRQTASLAWWEHQWASLRTSAHPNGFHIVTDRFWHATEARKMIFTERNRMGTGPSAYEYNVELADTKAGDEVHMLFGFKLPVILRRIDEQRPLAGAREMRYSFVGPCYLHGVMDGEILMDGSEAVEEILLC